VNMKVLMQEEFNLFPSGQALKLCVHGAITSSHSSNVSKYFAPLKPRGSLDYIQALLCPWNGKRSADGRAGRIQSIPLAALVGESDMG